MTMTFHTDIETLCELYRRIQLIELETEEDRIKELINMAEEGYNVTIFQTKRSKEEVVKDWLKHGDVLDLRKKEEYPYDEEESEEDGDYWPESETV